MSSTDSPALLKKPARSQLRWWTVHILRVVVLVYLGLAAIMFSIQDKFVFPGASTQGQRDTLLTASSSSQLLWLHTADGARIAALFGTALQISGAPLADHRDRPSIIFFYGNGSCMAYSTDLFDHLRRMGANVIIPDYEGYGMSSGKPSEAGCYATGNAAYNYLLSRDDINGRKIVLMGQSLGAATAIELASRRPAAGLITVSAFTNLSDMAKKLMHGMPIAWVLRYSFDNIDKMPKVSCPILIIHGTRDELVPYKSAERLEAVAKGKVTRYNVEGAGHNDVFDIGVQKLLHEIGEFLAHV